MVCEGHQRMPTAARFSRVTTGWLSQTPSAPRCQTRAVRSWDAETRHPLGLLQSRPDTYRGAGGKGGGEGDKSRGPRTVCVCACGRGTVRVRVCVLCVLKCMWEGAPDSVCVCACGRGTVRVRV